MSKSLFVEYRGQGFWAFDVVASVFLKHLVDVAEPRVAGSPEEQRLQTPLVTQTPLFTINYVPAA
jgi:hypothetical protein